MHTHQQISFFVMHYKILYSFSKIIARSFLVEKYYSAFTDHSLLTHTIYRNSMR
uniref:Uncharacterized protein n=1 Tax=Anguilla anguilla TaxID=7936 RepID=A0A0E9WK30_ANGAN